MGRIEPARSSLDLALQQRCDPRVGLPRITRLVPQVDRTRWEEPDDELFASVQKELSHEHHHLEIESHAERAPDRVDRIEEP
jgi:hypothetical protein